MTRIAPRLIVAAALLSANVATGAESAESRVEAEVAHLLDHLESSGCKFYRNGTWYTAGEASTHLEHKRDYLAKRSLIRSTEDFIDRAATASSVSGEAYLVSCAPEAPVPSSVWLRLELERIRTGAPGTPQ